MKVKEVIYKNNYIKPEIRVINLDNAISLWLMSENSIPNAPPWGGKNEKVYYTDPFKIERA